MAKINIVKQIRDICKFDSLDKNEQLKQAIKVLNNNSLKTDICSKIPDLSIKRLEKALRKIIKNLSSDKNEILSEIAYNEDTDDRHTVEKLINNEVKNRHKLDTYSMRETIDLLIASGYLSKDGKWLKDLKEEENSEQEENL